ncbi:MAG: DUF4834 family protein [Maribacter sp.]|nr:DUF4834 family protein [Maribacter sp.]
MTFLKTILIILLVYYLLKIVARWFVPRIFSYAARKTEERFRENFGGFANQNGGEEQKVGDVIIDKNATKKNPSSKNVGDYIEFEEID